MGEPLTPDELERARAIRLAVKCPCCGEPDDHGSVAYGCEACGRVVCGLCLQEGESDEPPYCLDCENPEEADRG